MAACFAMFGCMAPPWSSCIAEGSLVATPKGVVAMERPQVGDAVISEDAGGEARVASVTHLRSARSSRVLRVTLEDGRTLDATREHPVATSGGWRRAGDLAPGESLRVMGNADARHASTPSLARIRAVERVAGSRTVYDLTVEPHSVFFADGVLVRNKTIASPPTVASLAGDWMGVDEHSRLRHLRIGPAGDFTLAEEHPRGIRLHGQVVSYTDYRGVPVVPMKAPSIDVFDSPDPLTRKRVAKFSLNAYLGMEGELRFLEGRERSVRRRIWFVQQDAIQRLFNDHAGTGAPLSKP
jgi:hypothetical protein